MKKKCVFIGEQGTGKSCVLARLIKDEFIDNPNSTNTPVNTTMNFEYKGNTEKLELWDTAGQEQYRSVNKLFYKGAHICFLVYSIVDRKSFTELSKYWVPTVSSLLGPETSLCIVANKTDLFDNEEAIDETEGRNFAESVGAYFVSTSAKLGFGFPDILKIGLDSYYHIHPELLTNIKDDSEHVKKDINNDSNKKKGDCCGDKKANEKKEKYLNVS